MSKKKCYTVNEVQAILGVRRAIVYKLIGEKRFRAMCVARQYLIPKDSFDDWYGKEGCCYNKTAKGATEKSFIGTVQRTAEGSADTAGVPADCPGKENEK